MTDADFLNAFETASLPRPEWTHAAHLRMAYLYLRDNPDPDALLPFVRERICCYNAVFGNRTGYHETITAAFLRLVADRLRHEPSSTFPAFQETNPDLFADGVGVLLRHYSRETLFSPEARAAFVPPDREPLP
jgi:hypothetical protein